MRRIFLIFLLVAVGVLSLFSPFFIENIKSEDALPAYDPADIAWMLVASAFVLLMTPGLGFFYGGMVNKKNVISTILQSFIAMVVITVIWFIFGFGLSFGPDYFGIIGNPVPHLFMNGVGISTVWEGAPTIPILLFALFQLKFAIITPALISGGWAERVRFWGYLLFIVLFSIFIYSPLAHATWHPEGILAQWGVLDFAGGTVVHMSAGWAALAGAMFLRKRNDPEHKPSRITYVILGTSLLWFGWFGFNAGSSFGANELAVQAFANTTAASAAAALAWGFFDKIKGRKLSAMGVCIGAVVGLVAITPAAGFVTVGHSLFIGIFASMISNWVVQLRAKTGVDDTLDVFPCHGVGGIVGMILTGVFATSEVNGIVSEQGLFYGETSLFTKQLIAMVGTSVFAFCGTWLLLVIVNKITPLRVDAEKENLGLDISQHGESL